MWMTSRTAPLRIRPRLRLVYGVWVCFTPRCHGFGDTPSEAFRDWKENVLYVPEVG